MKSTADRRIAIRNFISEKRHTSYGELAQRFGVSESTIRRDLDAITAFTSFYATPGNGGGIHATEGWYASRRYYSAAQEDFLKKLRSGLQTEDDLNIMDEILGMFAMPQP